MRTPSKAAILKGNMTEVVHIDFETRSAVNLPKAGSDVYAQDWTTSILCMCYAFGDGPIHTWLPFQKSDYFDVNLDKLLKHIASGGKFAGHNAGGFEIPIWNGVCAFNYGWPELKAENCIDTMAQAFAMALPGSLDGASSAVGLQAKKDMKGRRVMLQLSQPRKILDDGTIIWWEPEDVPEKFEILYEYCRQDVEVERQLHNKLMALNEQEEKLWLLDWEINRRGVLVDRKSIDICLDITEYEKKRLNNRMKIVTKGAVATCNATGQLTDWLKWSGLEVPSVAKADVLDMLERDDLPKECREALLLRQEAAKTSTAKANAMRLGQCFDGRVRGLFQYHGAGTGRWAGRRVQLQNLPRPSLSQDQINHAFEIINSGKNIEDIVFELEMWFGSPMSVVSDCIRGFLKAKQGHDFIGCDFSSIEARVLAWLANQQDTLSAFETHGKIYEQEAAKIYNVDYLENVTKDQRMIGKVATLALGYQGGVGAFQSMAKVYGVKVPDEQADQIKEAWRGSNRNIVSYWYALEDAAIRAVMNPKKAFSVGPRDREVVYKKNGSFLWCKLPSNRVLCYPYAKVEEFETPWGQMKEGITYKTMVLGKWTKTKTYGGKLCENVTQAVARDCLAEAMPRLEHAGYPIVAHVHDETVVEVPKDFGSVEEVEKIMSENPVWAKGLPISAEGWRGLRYRK